MFTSEGYLEAGHSCAEHVQCWVLQDAPHRGVSYTYEDLDN